MTDSVNDSSSPTSSAASASSALARFCRPSTRYFDHLDENDYRHQKWLDGEYTEVEIIVEGSPEIFWKGFTWADLVSLLKNTYGVVWLSEFVFVTWHEYFCEGAFATSWVKCGATFGDGQDRNESASYGVERQQINVASVAESGPASYENLFQLLAQKSALEVAIQPEPYYARRPARPLPWPMATLSRFLETNGIHENILFDSASFSRAQCRVLSSFRESVSFWYCGFDDGGRAFLQEVACNRGPSKLKLADTDVDDSVYDALSSSTSLRKLVWEGVNRGTKVNIAQLSHALGQNRSLVDLVLTFPAYRITENEWGTFFRSLREHPTLEKLSLWIDVQQEHPDEEQRRRRSRVVVDFFETNEVLREIQFAEDYRLLDRWIHNEEIKPRLQRNNYRARLLSLSKEDTQRHILFGGAILNPVVNGNPTLTFFALTNFQRELVAQLSSETRKMFQLSRLQKKLSEAEADEERLSDEAKQAVAAADAAKAKAKALRTQLNLFTASLHEETASSEAEVDGNDNSVAHRRKRLRSHEGET